MTLTRTFGNLDVWISGYFDIWVSGYFDIRVSLILDIWIFGYLDILYSDICIMVKSNMLSHPYSEILCGAALKEFFSRKKTSLFFAT